MGQIKVLVVDDHSLVRTGVISLLQNTPDIDVIGEAENGREAIEKADELKPDVILIDISMPEISGIEATALIKEKNPSIHLLILTMHESEEYFYNAIKKGASGILHKNTSREELILAIRIVAKGDKYFGNSLSKLLFESLLHKYDEDGNQNKGFLVLTKREREVLHFVGKGYSNQQIADQLSISTRTVDSHKGNLMQKLNIKSASALARYAFENDYLIDNE